MLLNEETLEQSIKGTSKLLLEQYIGDQFSQNAEYDLFISHSYQDKEKIVELRCFFDKLGYNVYIDWIDDAVLDRNNVTPDTADTIRYRIGKCKALAYVVSENIKLSKWCPWELGVADGLLGKVCILPIMEGNKEQYAFRGREYLGLYPYLSFNGQSNDPVIRNPLKNSPKQFWDLSSTLSGMLYSIDLRNWLNSGDVA